MATFSGTLGWVRKAFPSISLSEVRSWRVKMIRIRIKEGQVIHMKVQWWAVWPLCRNFRLGSWPGLSEGSVALLYNCNQGYLPSLWHWWSSTQYDLGQWFSKICWAFNYLPLTSDPKFIKFSLRTFLLRAMIALVVKRKYLPPGVSQVHLSFHMFWLNRGGSSQEFNLGYHAYFIFEW